MWIDFDGELVKATEIWKCDDRFCNTYEYYIKARSASEYTYKKKYKTKEERDQAYFEIYQLVSTKSLFYKL